MHESHNDFSNLAKMTPAEISRRKSDRDLQQSQELQLARARALAGPNGAGTRTPVCHVLHYDSINYLNLLQ